MKRLFFVFVFALVVLVITQGHATTIRPMSVEQMTNAASTVVEAHALNSWSAWNAQHTMIYTYTRLQVTNTLKGSPESYILVKQLAALRMDMRNTLRASGNCSPVKRCAIPPPEQR